MIGRSMLLLITPILAIACASDPNTGAGITYGEPYFDMKNPGPLDADRLEEYDALYTADLAPHTRAWVREADRVIRANNEVYGRKPDDREDKPWLTRMWLKFSSLFTGR